MKTKIDQLWDELESDKSISSGLLIRRYSSSILPDVYVAVKRPENIFALAIRVARDSNLRLARYANLKDIEVKLVPDDKNDAKNYLLITLSSKQYRDVFGTLCEDLIFGLRNVKDQSRIFEIVLNRLEKWRSLFEKASLSGLSSEEQRGLYGELYFLRKWLRNSKDPFRCVESWVGIKKELRDFQSEGWAIEVKTTYGNNHQRLHINSERQLDTANLNFLFLYHVSLESQQKHGETLNQLANSILDLLSNDFLSLGEFKSKLLEGGYYPHHAPLYENVGYHIRQELYYLVNNNFPRIEEKDIRAGVGDVKYTIILSDFSSHLIEQSLLFNSIN